MRCDGCDQNPIIGPLWRSKTRRDFDLCQACVAGEAADDFDRVEHSVLGPYGTAGRDPLRFGDGAPSWFGRPLSRRRGEAEKAFSKLALLSCCPGTTTPLRLSAMTAVYELTAHISYDILVMSGCQP